jgi:hypothetical protein
MKTIQAFFLLVVTPCCYSQEQPVFEYKITDDPIYQVAKGYFRSNPFDVHFSTFLNHLTHDPTLFNVTMNKRTDTSLFFFHGDYKGHNPYSFKANRVEIRLAEREVNMDDSLKTIDTLLFYQLVGYSYGAAGVEAVKKEFAKFDRKYGKHFYSEDSELKKDDEIVGVSRNYFLLSSTFLSPLSISWAKLDDYQNVFTITFRIKLEQNMAILPNFPDGH